MIEEDDPEETKDMDIDQIWKKNSKHRKRRKINEENDLKGMMMLMELNDLIYIFYMLGLLICFKSSATLNFNKLLFL